MIQNLRNMHEEDPSAHGSENEDGTGVSGLGPLGPACKVGDLTQADATAA